MCLRPRRILCSTKTVRFVLIVIRRGMLASGPLRWWYNSSFSNCGLASSNGVSKILVMKSRSDPSCSCSWGANGLRIVPTALSLTLKSGMLPRRRPVTSSQIDTNRARFGHTRRQRRASVSKVTEFSVSLIFSSLWDLKDID